MGDIIDPMGLSFKSPMPLLWHHQHDKPIGHAYFDKPTKNGVRFRAELAQVEEPGALKDRLDEAWQSIKAKLVRGVSIGFRAIETAFLDGGGVHFIKSEVLELSLVTIPANADASITSFKSIDKAMRAASGQPEPRPVVRLNQPGVSGVSIRSKGTTDMKTLAEQIAALEATRAAKAARMTEIMQKTADEGRSTDEADAEEFDTLEAEIKTIDADLKRLAAAEAINRTAAKPAPAAATPAQARTAVQHSTITLKQELPKGTAFTRYVMALANAQGNALQAAEMAKRWHNSTPEVEQVLRAIAGGMSTKAAVTPGTVLDADWAAPLVNYRIMADEMIELLRPATIIGRIPGLRNVPFMVKIPVQTQGSLVNWVGEAKAKPVGELKFVSITLDHNKVAGIVVLSEELVRLSSPSAEATVRADLVAQISAFLDVEFIDPANAAVANVSPASILNGVAAIPSSGTTVVDLRTDLQALIGAFVGANLGLSDAVWITTESIALQISMLQNPLGQPEFAGMGINGGTMLGRPVIASQAVPAGVLALVKASEILIADDGGVTIDASREATLTMDSAPADPATATFSLWQNNCVGIRAERWITWKRRRDAAVAHISGADYTGVAP